MIIYPAIDIKDKKVVRLAQGKFDRVTEYSTDPISVAKKWIEDGAQWLHVVDLDAALTSGETHNREIILALAKEVSVPIQTGGGIRSQEDIAALLKGGISRVILGTKAITDQAFLKNIIDQWDDQIAVSLDCSNGYLTKLGWTSISNLKAVDYVNELKDMGVKTFIYTDIAHDGMLDGPNLPALKELLSATQIELIASGGISNIDDIKNLKAMEGQGISGAITGKAIYEQTLNLKEAIEIAK